MAKTYNPYNDIAAIVGLKNTWTNATDNETRNKAATDATAYYQRLRDNDYNDVADTLQKSDYTTAQKYADNYVKSNQTAIRPYLENSELSTTYGMSKNDINNLVKFDEGSGTVSLGGINLGKPNAIVNGTSYWDEDTLKSGLNNYLSTSGLTAPTQNLKSAADTKNRQMIDNLFGTQTDDHGKLRDTYYDEIAYAQKTNPFETEIGKAIMGKYNLSSLNARDNAVASGGAPNSGNLDSYAAANALRQQSALISQGQDAVLKAHQQRLDNVRQLLDNLGITSQNNYTSMQNTIGLNQNEAQRLFENDETTKKRLFENEETAKNNEVNRLVQQSTTTGYNPTEWIIKNDPVYSMYLNTDGTLKEQYKDTDFQALINRTNDASLKNKLAVVRTAKGNTFKEFESVLPEGDIAYLEPQKNAEYDSTLKQIDSAERIAEGETAMDKYKSDKAAETDITVQQLKNEGEKISADNTVYIDGVQASDKNGKPLLDEEATQKAVDSGNITPTVQYAMSVYGIGSISEDKKAENISQTEDDIRKILTYDNLNDYAEGFKGEQIDYVTKELVPFLANLFNDDNAVADGTLYAKLQDELLRASLDNDIEWEQLVGIYKALGLPYSAREWLNEYENKPWAGKGIQKKN